MKHFLVQHLYLSQDMRRARKTLRDMFIICKIMSDMVSVLDEHTENPTKYLWRWEPDRRNNFFNPSMCCHIYN